MLIMRKRKEQPSEMSRRDEEEENHCLPKKKRRKEATQIKPPTSQEMKQLSEAENLFHSNVFHLQTVEMINELKTKKTERNRFKKWWDELKDFILSIKLEETIALNEASYPKGIRNPLPALPVDEVKGISTFHKPVEVTIVGSYNAGCTLGPSLSVDVAVVMPKECFLKGDFLNARYQRKRAVYLGLLAHALQSSELVDGTQGVSWVVPDGDLLSPRLMLSPACSMLKDVKVTLMAIPHTHCFKLSRFTPDKNNIRASWLFGSEAKDSDSPAATPLYNTSVMRDLVILSNEVARKQALDNNNNLKDAITLLRVWLRQRQLDIGDGSFSGFLVSMLVTGLVLKRQLNTFMSSYQIVRKVWLILGQSDWTKEGFTMCFTKQEPNTPSLEGFNRHFDVVFVDTTGYCNLAARVDRLTYLRVKNEAQLAVQYLDDPSVNSFQALFMTPMPFIRQFDHIIRIQKESSMMTEIIFKQCTTEERMDHLAVVDRLFVRVVSRLLERGLGGRVTQIAVKLDPARKWLVGAKPQDPDCPLLLGLRLNPDTAYSVVDRGPADNEPHAAEFRLLWGDRCELRRFQDGVVCNAVVWAKPTAPLAKRRLITKKMAFTLLGNYLGLPLRLTTYLADQIEPLIMEKAYVSEGTGEEAGLAVIQAFDRLARQLRELPDLPLEVVSVQGVSAVFHGAEVFPPLARKGRPQVKSSMEGVNCWMLTSSPALAPDYIPAICGLVQLSLSHKWPEDVDAIRRIKAAFHIKLANALQKKFDFQTQPFPDHLDIFKEGYVFRLSVVCPLEVALLKKAATPDGKVYYRDTPESLALEKFTQHSPKLNTTLHGLQQQWPACGVTWRLAKRWMSAQLIDDNLFPNVATELLVASLFVSAEPFQRLLQPQPMFLHFLNLLANTNWKIEPKIINFNKELTRDDLTEIESRFQSERASLPPLFIATPYDKGGSVWTKEAPLLPVLVRVSRLAAEALGVLEAKLLGSALKADCQVVFRPPMELYDVLIHLRPLMVPQRIRRLDNNTPSRQLLKAPKNRGKMPITDFDPAQLYLKELRDGYGEWALFFYDSFGGLTIGVLFKPQVFENRDFKVSNAHCHKALMKEGSCLKFNMEGVLEDFYNLGVGLVKNICPQSSRVTSHMNSVPSLTHSS